MLNAKLYCLPDIFANNRFSIPDYQRGYSWDKLQVDDMLKDIDHLMNDGQDLRHYTGTLVLSPRKDVEKVFDVVDGQQRLTTLTILLSVLREYLSKEKSQEVNVRYLWRGDIGNEYAVLELNKETRNFHERVILGEISEDNEPPTLESHNQLLEAKENIQRWMEEKQRQGSFDFSTILNSVETELGFLVYTPQDDAEVGIMFEVINNRGKALSELEKVKNYLIYCCAKLGSKTLRKNINDDWSEILRNLNRAECTNVGDEGSFLRYCAVVHMRLGKNNSQYVYDEMKKWICLEEGLVSDQSKTEVNNKIKGFVDFLKISSLWYARLHGRQHDGLPAELISVLDQIRAQGQFASIMPIFLALVIRLDGKGSDLLRLLSLLEILNFRVYMAVGIATRTDSGQGYLYSWASSYYYGELKYENEQVGRTAIETQEQALEHRLVEFILDYCSDSRLEASLVLEKDSNFNFYKWSGIRYFLMNYEAKLQPKKMIKIDQITRGRQEGKSNDYYSIEHIWATEHRNEPGQNNRPVDVFEKYRLGNFILLELGLNSQGSNKDILEKLPIYLESTDLQQVRDLNKDVLSIVKRIDSRLTKNHYRDRHAAINDRQEKRFVAFAKERWSVIPYLGYKYYSKQMTENEE